MPLFDIINSNSNLNKENRWDELVNQNAKE